MPKKISVNLTQDEWMVVVCALRRERDFARKTGRTFNRSHNVVSKLEQEIDAVRYGMVMQQTGKKFPANAVL